MPTGEQLLSDVCVGLHAFSRTDAPPEHILPTCEALFTQVLKENAARVLSEPLRASTQQEVDGLIERGAIEVLKKRSLPEGASIVGGRFVHTQKHVGSPEERPKSRYASQGHKGRYKRLSVHNLSTLRQRSTRMVVSTSAVRWLRLFAHDVNHSYRQSMEKMTCGVYLQPRAADRAYFGIGEDEVLQLVRLPYGICDAGDHWAATFTAHVEDDLGIVPTTGDPALYVRDGTDGVDGLMGTYVDDSILGGNENFQVLTGATLRQFDAKPRQWDNFEFLGVTIASTRGADCSAKLIQANYVAALSPLKLSATYDEFASVYAFANAFDEAFVIKHDLERIYKRHIPLIMLTDAQQLFDVFTRASHLTGKRLIINLAAAREAYNDQEISSVGLIKSEHNAADGLTKPYRCAALERTLTTREDNNPVQQ
eukprot:contig_4436_g959